MHRYPCQPSSGIALPALPLFAWAGQSAQKVSQTANIRLILLDTCRDADGEPRAALAVPGTRLPVVYPTLAAALAAKVYMETAR